MRQTKLPLLAGGLLSALYLIHFLCLRPFFVDVPYFDEWEGMGPERIPENLSFAYLRMQHNEHRIFWTRLQTWLFYKWTNWDLVLQQESNFLIFGLLLLALYWFSRTMLPELSSIISLTALAFFLTPRNHENHFWGFQSQFHCVLLFFVLTLVLLFHPSQRREIIFLGAISLVSTMYSFSAGVPLTTVVALSFLVFKIWRFFAQPSPRPRRELFDGCVVLLIYAASLFSWVYDYRPFTGHPAYVLPNKREFWLFLANFVAHGFGVDRVDRIGSGVGVSLLVWCLVPLCGLILSKRTRQDSRSWGVMTALLALFAAASVVAMGRAGFNYSFMAKSSRYAEIANLFILFCVLAWALVLRNRKLLCQSAIALTLLCCFVANLDNWDFTEVYAKEHAKRVAVLQCAVDYYQHKNDGFCPELYPFPMADRLDRAKEQRLSFYQRYVEGS